jgi:hypothetical protein
MPQNRVEGGRSTFTVKNEREFDVTVVGVFSMEGAINRGIRRFDSEAAKRLLSDARGKLPGSTAQQPMGDPDANLIRSPVAVKRGASVKLDVQFPGCADNWDALIALTRPGSDVPVLRPVETQFYRDPSAPVGSRHVMGTLTLQAKPQAPQARPIVSSARGKGMTRVTETSLRRIVRQMLMESGPWDPLSGVTRIDPVPSGAWDPASGVTRIDPTPSASWDGVTRIDPMTKVGAGAAAGEGTAVAAGVSASAAAAVLGAALLGLAVGTVINQELEKRGVNDAVIKWILAQRFSKAGINFEVSLHSMLRGNISAERTRMGDDRPASFEVTGVYGLLVDPDTNAVINSKSFYSLKSGETPFNATAKIRMPKHPDGVFVPAQVIGKINYESGASVNAVSGAGMMTMPGSNTIRAVLTDSKRLGVKAVREV